MVTHIFSFNPLCVFSVWDSTILTSCTVEGEEWGGGGSVKMVDPIIGMVDCLEGPIVTMLLLLCPYTLSVLTG